MQKAKENINQKKNEKANDREAFEAGNTWGKNDSIAKTEKCEQLVKTMIKK